MRMSRGTEFFIKRPFDVPYCSAWMAQKAPGRSERKGLTIVQLLRIFPDDDTAERWFEKQRWPEGPVCPKFAQIVSLPPFAHYKANINTMKTHHLFISHSWTYSDHYNRLKGLLEDRPYFDFKDYSVPKDDPVQDADNDKELRAAIKAQMKSCGVVLIVAGVYASYSKWIKIEIDLAQNGFEESKPILAIKPYGNTNVSTVVNDAADEIVNWNTESIVAAIRRLDK